MLKIYLAKLRAISMRCFSVGILFCILPVSHVSATSTIIHGGDILTMVNENGPLPEAVLVEDGVITWVGELEEALRDKKSEANIIDLEGKTLMPGFIAVHSHPDVVAAHHSFVDLSAYANERPNQVWKKLESSVNAAKEGEWVFAKGLDLLMMPSLDAPKLDYLNRISPNKPLFIFSQMLHSAWANSAALREMGVTKSTLNPAADSYFEKDADGNLTGYIHETAAIKMVSEHLLESIDIKKNVVQALDDYARSGTTTVSTMGLMDNSGELLYLYDYLGRKEPTLVQRFLAFIGLLPEKKPSLRHFVYLTDEGKHLLPETVNNGDDFFKILGVKFWYDGSGSTGSMYSDEAYLDTKTTRSHFRIPAGFKGKNIYPQEVLHQKIKVLDNEGWQVAVHAIGDRANRETIEIFKDISEQTNRSNTRHRVEHSVFLPRTSISDADKAGLTFSFQVNYLYYYANAMKNEVVGAARTERMLPLRSVLKETNIPFTLHADAPAFPQEPLSLVQTVSNRKSVDGLLINPGESIPVWEALKSITINAAWQLHMETKIGSIEVGKYADFVLLDRNPLKVGIDNLRDIMVKGTMVGGQLVYSAE